jgi:hypothetical protein
MAGKPRGRPRRIVDRKLLHERIIKGAKVVEERCLGQPEARGDRAQADAQFLNRIISEDRVIDAWARMRECAPIGEQEEQVIDEQVIKAMLDARTDAERLPQLHADPKMESTLLILKAGADLLYEHFLHTQEPFSDNRRDAVLRLLNWIQGLFDEKLKAFSEKVRGPTVSRQLQTPAGRRGVFMRKMSKVMVEIFGTPLDEAVAALTDVAFERPSSSTTVKQVMTARMYRQRRAKVN